jgi:hypothetical protein
MLMAQSNGAGGLKKLLFRAGETALFVLPPSKSQTPSTCVTHVLYSPAFWFIRPGHSHGAIFSS